MNFLVALINCNVKFWTISKDSALLVYLSANFDTVSSLRKNIAFIAISAFYPASFWIDQKPNARMPQRPFAAIAGYARAGDLFGFRRLLRCRGWLI